MLQQGGDGTAVQLEENYFLIALSVVALGQIEADDMQPHVGWLFILQLQ